MELTEFRKELLKSPLLFTKYIFKNYYNKEYHIGEHHRIIAEALKKVLLLETTRLIINIAPRYGKTELVVKMFMAMGLALNPKSLFIHVTHSEKLALDNSEAVRNIIKSDAYSRLFNLKTKKDSDSKSKWYNEEGGGVYATSSGGQIFGFGAGSLDSEDGFSGAFIFDDPIKPEDVFSLVIREGINQRFDTTFRSRLNSEKTPIIIIMPRFHKRDLTGYLLEEEPGVWTVLSLSALKPDGTALWDFKLPVKELLHLQKVNNYVFQTQYQQKVEEIQTGGEFWKDFDPGKHIQKISYNENHPIHISVDNNVLPYIAVSFWQKYDNKIIQIHEIPCTDPFNTATKAGLKIAEYIKQIRYIDLLFVHGDVTANIKNTIDDDKKSFFDKLIESLEKEGIKVRNSLSRSNPPVALSGQFINSLYAGAYKYEIIISDTCQISISDYVNVKETDEGTILKKKVTDPYTKASYEEFGHFTDVKRYVIIDLLNSEFIQYKSGGKIYDYVVSPESRHR